MNFNCSNELFVSVFVDSAYADDITTRRSSYGYVLLGCDGALGWASRMHKAVCTSTCEAEYRSLSECMKEMLYIQNTMQETYMTDQSVCDVFIDNKGAKSLAESPKRGKYTKHLEVHAHFCRQVISEPNVRAKLKYVKTEYQLADIFTKPLSRKKFVYFRQKIGVY